MAVVRYNPVRVYVRNKTNGALVLAQLRMPTRKRGKGKVYYTGPLFSDVTDAQRALRDYGDPENEYVLLPAVID